MPKAATAAVTIRVLPCRAIHTPDGLAEAGAEVALPPSDAEAYIAAGFAEDANAPAEKLALDRPTAARILSEHNEGFSPRATASRLNESQIKTADGQKWKAADVQAVLDVEHLRVPPRGDLTPADIDSGVR